MIPSEYTPLEEHPSQHRDPNQRTDRVAEALGRLDQTVSAIHDSDAFRRYLDVQARFHRYSYGNVLLILSARPTATHVAGYRAWQSLGRQVRRGERGIRILVPMKVREPGGQTITDARDTVESAPTPSETDSSTDPASARRRLLFGVGTVFDVSQTDGEPLPSIDVPVLGGADGAALYSRLEAVAQEAGLTIERGSPRLTRPETMGFYSPTERLIVLRETGQLQMTKTLAHELAHHYVTLAHHGLDSGARSFPYVATWSRETTVLRAALSEIQTISSRLIDLTHTGVSDHVRMETAARQATLRPSE